MTFHPTEINTTTTYPSKIHEQDFLPKLLDSRPNSSNGNQIRIIDSSPNSSMGSKSNAPPPYHPNLIHSPDTRTQLFVGNLPFRIRWQDLKDLFRKAGTVLRADVSLTNDNRSKGFGTVLFANRYDALKAIEIYNGFSWQTRTLDVRLDQQDPIGTLAMSAAPLPPHRLLPPPPNPNWHPVLPPVTLHAQLADRLGPPAAVDALSALSLNTPSAPPEHGLPAPAPPQPSSFRLAHQQHQSAQSLTCADLIRSSSARLSDPTSNSRLSASLSLAPRRGSAATLLQQPPPLPAKDGLRPGFRPLSLATDDPNLPAPSLLKELMRPIPNGLSEPGAKDDIQNPSNSLPSIVFPYCPTTATSSSAPMSSTGSSGNVTHRSSSKNSPAAPPSGTMASSNRHLFVGNLPFNCQWQDLKDLFRNAGNILRADVATGADGRSKGFGTVLFATADDAINAVRTYDGHEFHGRTLKVYFDKFTIPPVSPSIGIGPGAPLDGPYYQGAEQNGGRQRVPPHQYNSVTGYSNYFPFGNTPVPNPAGSSRPPVKGNRGLDPERVPGNQSSSLPSPLRQHHYMERAGSFQSSSHSPQRLPQLPQHMGPFYTSKQDHQSLPFAPPDQTQMGQFAPDPSDLWGPDRPTTNTLHERTAPPIVPPLSPIASRRSSYLKSDGQPVQPIGHPTNPSLLSGQTRPNSIPMPPPYELPGPGAASLTSPPTIQRGIQMTPSMPAFSFQPYPATPPLLPNFFSPGIGPSTPPSSAFSSGAAQRGARNGCIGAAPPSSGYSGFNSVVLGPPPPTSAAGLGPSNPLLGVPPTSGNHRKAPGSPLGYNPMFPPPRSNISISTAETNGDATAAQLFDGSSGLPTVAADGPPLPHPGLYSYEPRNSAAMNGVAMFDKPSGPSSPQPPLPSSDHHQHRHSSSSDRRGLPLPTSDSPSSASGGGVRFQQGILEQQQQENPSQAQTPQLRTLLSNVDWGYSPLGSTNLSNNRRASFFVSPSHFHQQLSAVGGSVGGGHHALGGGSCDLGSSSLTGKQNGNFDVIQPSECEVNSDHDLDTTRSKHSSPPTRPQKETEEGFLAWKQNNSSIVAQILLNHEDAGAGANRRASFDVRTLIRNSSLRNRDHDEDEEAGELRSTPAVAINGGVSNTSLSHHPHPHHPHSHRHHHHHHDNKKNNGIKQRILGGDDSAASDFVVVRPFGSSMLSTCTKKQDDGRQQEQAVVVERLERHGGRSSSSVSTTTEEAPEIWAAE